MKLLIDTKSVKILDEEIITSGGFNNTILDVEFSDEYKNLVTFITFNNIKRMVIGNKVNVPTLEEGVCQIGAYGIESVNDETILRYSPQPAYIQVKKGSYNDNLTDPTLPTQSEYEAMIALINQAIEDGKLKGDKGDKGDKGEPGEKGDNGINGSNGLTANIVVGTTTTLPAGRNAIVTNELDPATNTTTFNFGIPKGDEGKPATENNFELIEEVSITSDGLLTKSTEPDGTKYNFKKMFVYISSPSSITTQPQVITSFLSNSNTLCSWYITLGSASINSFVTFLVYNMNGLYLGEARKSHYNEGNTNNIQASTNHTISAQNITKFQTTVKAGMKISIYGVRP